jgi:beta-xylosidase
MLFNLYLDHVIIEWLDSNLIQTIILTTILFADDQVIMTASEDSLQILLYQLSITASAYNQTVSITKTKILALRGKN